MDKYNTIINNANDRWVEIYKITNTVNNQLYIGQAISHIKKHNKYIPHGMEGRFQTHLSEAKLNLKKYACVKLNNALNKYGWDKFKLELIMCCALNEANDIETREIIKHNSLSPAGYNLTTSCKSTTSSIEFCEKISEGIMSYHIEKRLSNIDVYNVKNITIVDIIVRPKFKKKIQVGWYIKLKDLLTNCNNRQTINFESQMLNMEENKNRAIEFIKTLLNRSNTAKLREVT